MNIKLLQLAARDARGLAIDAVSTCNSGHLGLPLGAAEIGAVLFGEFLRIDPSHHSWINRDRFILSAGHGSMFLYAWLHLAGFELPLDQIKKFRQLHSITPGHPEFQETPGVEATTGPLGQGVANAIGYAMSQKMAASRFNTDQHTILDNHVIVLCGDGCLQEGVSSEASTLAGHLGLDNLILLLDSNNVTLDAMLNVSQSEDVAARYVAYGWHVQIIDGHNMDEILTSLNLAKATQGKPHLIICKTIIGKGIPQVEGTNKAHGEAGVKFSAEARKKLGLPDTLFYISPEVLAYFDDLKAKRSSAYASWEQKFHAWSSSNPQLASLLHQGIEQKVSDLLSLIPVFKPEDNLATRKAGNIVLQSIARALPLLVSGSADLFGSTLNYIEEGGDFSRNNNSGRNIHFGIREHAMCAIMNGYAYDGIFRIVGATFLVFSDYGRPAIRVAALSKLPTVYIFTHDSVAVGEDGPTHEPVETIAALRAIPGLDVIRPADPEETVAAFVAAIERNDGPTLIALSRQPIPNLNEIPSNIRRQGVFKGAYIALQESSPLELIILATGSELYLALDAAKILGHSVRVVSMPCMERFERQETSYREAILPSNCRKRISIEAGIADPWFRYIGIDGKTISINRFGLSAPGGIILKELGVTVDNLIAVAKSLHDQSSHIQTT